MPEPFFDKCVYFVYAFLAHSTTQYILEILFWTHFCLFLCLLLMATVGKRFGIRRRYIAVLDRVFLFAASKINEKQHPVNVAEEVLEDDEFPEEQRVIISPEFPVYRRRLSNLPGRFSFEDSIPYLRLGMQAIVEDCVNKSFSPEELPIWNMLSRTKNKSMKAKSKTVTSLWLIGFVVRYLFLVPVRLAILIISLTSLLVITLLVGRLPDGQFKKKMNAFFVCWCFDFVAGTLSVDARFHNRENKPDHGIAVANHTSPIDSMVLATDNCYDMVGQKTGGFLGVFMKALSKSSTHIWFERTSGNQRSDATKRLLEHSKNTTLPPVLIFPEGICVNNTAVLLFRKGVFELDTDIFPIAIKFDPRYGDAFWHKYGFFRYCLTMMTSWAIVCDVWYLPPMRRKPDESPIKFASRVKSAIAQKGGLLEIEWDGIIKVIQKDRDRLGMKERTWRNKQQLEFAKYLQRQEHISSSL